MFYFLGSLWQCYRFTGDETLAEAGKIPGRLEGIQYYKGRNDLPHGLLQLRDADAARPALKAVIEAATSFRVATPPHRPDPFVGFRRVELPGHHRQHDEPRDALLGLGNTGDPVYRDVAVRHADITMKNHFRDDASSFHVGATTTTARSRAGATFQGYSDSSAWARGQAWGLYGYTMCYRETGDAKYLKHAERIADFIMHHPNTPADRIPYWDYNAPTFLTLRATLRPRRSFRLLCSSFRRWFPKPKAKKVFRLCRDAADESFVGRLSGQEGCQRRFHSDAQRQATCPPTARSTLPLNYADYYYLESHRALSVAAGRSTRGGSDSGTEKNT